MYNTINDLLDALRATPETILGLLQESNPEEAGLARGGDENWSVIEIICHLRDAEERALELFPPLSSELLAVLKGLSIDDWQRGTACPSWTVKDVAAHLLCGNIRRLSSHRGNLPGAVRPVRDYSLLFDMYDELPRPSILVRNNRDLVRSIDRQNGDWVEAARVLDSDQLVEFLDVSDRHVYELFKATPENEPANISVAWAGDRQSPNWFDIAREYTEKWLHQQHIREAVDQPVLSERQWLFPVLDTFMRALPHTYRTQQAQDGTKISFRILGEAGGDWSLVRQNGSWALYYGTAHEAVSTVLLEQDLAWRLFTKGMTPEAAQSQVQIEGDLLIGREILNMVSIMA